MPSTALVRHLVLPALLLVVYGLGWMIPGPGQSLQTWTPAIEAGGPLAPSSSQLLVAVLLFVAAIAVDWGQLVNVARRPLALTIALLAVWAVPALVAAAASRWLALLAPSDLAAPLAAGFVLVAAMPVANSAAGWTQQSQGDLPWALGLIIGSIVLCPWATPVVLHLLGLSLDVAQSQVLDSLTHELSGVRFILWVLLPTAGGMLLRRIIGHARVDACRRGLLITSAVALLLLNYINAAVALPSLSGHLTFATLLVTIATSCVLCGTGYLVAYLLRRTMGLPAGTALALSYSLSMKHTGLALALASSALVDQPDLFLPILLTALVQHIIAGIMHGMYATRSVHS